MPKHGKIQALLTIAKSDSALAERIVALRSGEDEEAAAAAAAAAGGAEADGESDVGEQRPTSAYGRKAGADTWGHSLFDELLEKDLWADG